VAHGGNPYDGPTIYAAEQAAQHYPDAQPSLGDFVDFPSVALLLRGFAWLPYWPSYALFTGLGLAVAGLALWVWLRELGWPRSGVWVAAALLSWPLLLGVFMGQLDLLMLGGLVAALILMRRDAPWTAGLCMVVVLLKPHLMWPVPLLLGAAWAADPPRLRRFAAAAAVVLAGGAALGFLLVPHSINFFPHLLSFDSRVTSDQPDLAGIPGLVAQLPSGGQIGDAIAAAGAVLVVWLGVAALRDPRLRGLAAERRCLIPLTGLAIWLALTPYAHPNDDVLLFPLLAMVIGERGGQLDGRWLEAGILGSLALIAAFVVSPALGVALLAVALMTWVGSHHRMGGEAAAALALAALAIVPDLWPFHVVSVSPTPVAVALIAIAGAMALRGQVRGASLSLAAAPRPSPQGAMR
jgi:hypothetical protein